jgi:hypothetical protein
MLTIGADPEFFVRRRNHWVSGHVFNCGTKEFPMPTEHGSVQVDGVALECNVHPAVTEEGLRIGGQAECIPGHGLSPQSSKARSNTGV